MLILSDDIAKKDLIGHQDYRDGILQVIKSVKSVGSFTIGIFGNWGTGKTSFLTQLKECINNITNDEKSYITTWFNPWQFAEEKHLIIPFFHVLKIELEKEIKKNEKLNHKIKKFINELSIIPDALLYGMEWKLKTPFIEFKYSNKDTLDRADIKINELEQCKSLNILAEKYESTYYNLLGILKKASKEFDAKIIVFIDDLDRCLPEKAVQLIEGLKVLMDLPNFIFVLGVSRNVIEQGVRLRYSQYYNNQSKNFLDNIEENYLDKIIQFPFTLPAAEPSRLIDNLLKSHLKQIDGLDIYSHLIHDVIGNNPRTLKRFLNTISFTLYIAKQKGILNSEVMEAVVKLSLLAYLFPVLYRQIENSCIDLVKIENVIFASIDNVSEKTLNYSILEKNKTGLIQVDNWLDGRFITKLFKIIVGNSSQPTFKNSTNVLRFIHLLSTSVEAELESKEVEIDFKEISLNAEIENRLTKKEKKGNLQGLLKIDKYLMIQALYKKVMEDNPSYFTGDNLPVDTVSWLDAITFCNKLSEKTGNDKIYTIENDKVIINYSKKGFRLPTVDEWEYACLYEMDEINEVNIYDVGWLSKNAKNKTQEVGQKRPNNLGIYDSIGNVWEWCDDANNNEDIIIEVEKLSQKSMKGGSYSNAADFILKGNDKIEYSDIRDNIFGFRIVFQEK